MSRPRIFGTSFSAVYPLYVQKVERKGRTRAEVDQVICWVVCGVRGEAVDDPLRQKIRWSDKLVDELAKGKPLDKVLR